MPLSPRQALWDIEHCRTEALGGEVSWCPQCQEDLSRYHSCGNRHCPKGESDRADTWRDKQLEPLLPVPSFLVTFPLPPTRNPRARAHQKRCYNLLFQTSADALQTLAHNPDWVGGQIGMIGVLHTWDRTMGYHLHVHDLAPAGGIDPPTGAWMPAHPKFPVPGAALRTVFRAKFRAALQTAAPDLFAQVPPATRNIPWVVHCQAVGDGRAALKYLAPDVYRVALSNRRLVNMAEGKVTFRDKPRKHPWKTMTLDALSFIQRFLQHVLPTGFQKVRSFGFLHPSARARFAALQAHLTATAARPIAAASPVTDTPSLLTHPPDAPGVCPHGGSLLQYLGRLPRSPRGPP